MNDKKHSESADSLGSKKLSSQVWNSLPIAVHKMVPVSDGDPGLFLRWFPACPEDIPETR